MYQKFAEDADFLLRIGDRVASRIKTPPTLDREDVVQDAVVAAIELLRAGWVPPERFPFDLALILAVRRKLGARAAYWSEWQWSRRRMPQLTDDHETATPPFDPVGDLLDFVPEHVRDVGRLLLSGTPANRIHTTLGVTRDSVRAAVLDFRAALDRAGMWHDDLLLAQPRPRRPKKGTNE